MQSHIRFMHTVNITTLIFCIRLISSENHTQPFSHYHKLLATDPVASMIPMEEHLRSIGKNADFHSRVFLVTLQSGMRAVFKPGPYRRAMTEPIASRIAADLGFPDVPPAVIRIINEELGSLQLYVQSSYDTLEGDTYDTAWNAVPELDRANYMIFAFIFGQWDIGPENQIFVHENGTTRLFAIDNEHIIKQQYVQRYGEAPFVWRAAITEAPENITTNALTKFPFHEAQTLKHPTMQQLVELFGTALAHELRQFTKGVRRYVLYRQSLWIQYPHVRIPFSERIPLQTLTKIETISAEKIKDWFTAPNGTCMINDDHIAQILERKSMILSYFKTHPDAII